MITDDRRVRIITGQFGSGKTEFAVNYVRKLAKLVKRPAIADLDIVNPYFRSRQKAELLQNEGIEVISSSITTDSSDMPALSQRIMVPFLTKDYDYVVDLGGSSDGTIVLGRLFKYIDQKETDFFMVVNVFRPETENVQGILDQKELIEKSSGLKVTAFINNTNLIHETREEHIIYGNDILKEASAICGVPIKYTTLMTDEGLDKNKIEPFIEGELFQMHYNMRSTWL
jgi:hypothetical protein